VQYTPAGAPGSSETITATYSGDSNYAAGLGTLVLAVGAPASLALSPTSGIVGSQLKATGTGFASMSSVTLKFGTKSVTSCTTGSLTTDTTGAFSCSFAVPSAPNGPQTVVATDTAKNSASAVYTVAAHLALKPLKGPVGKPVTAKGTGFAAAAAIAFTFDGTPVASTCVSGATGSFSCAFTVPSGFVAGVYVVVATDALGDTASATFRLT
jgi:hypothetical protein